MTAAAPRFLGSRLLTAGDGSAVLELVVRVGDLEARAYGKAGQGITAWKVTRAGRWTREGVTLTEMRASRQLLPALAKCCSRLERSAA